MIVGEGPASCEGHFTDDEEEGFFLVFRKNYRERKRRTRKLKNWLRMPLIKKWGKSWRLRQNN